MAALLRHDAREATGSSALQVKGLSRRWPARNVQGGRAAPFGPGSKRRRDGFRSSCGSPAPAGLRLRLRSLMLGRQRTFPPDKAPSSGKAPTGLTSVGPSAILMWLVWAAISEQGRARQRPPTPLLGQRPAARAGSSIPPMRISFAATSALSASRHAAPNNGLHKVAKASAPGLKMRSRQMPLVSGRAKRSQSPEGDQPPARCCMRHREGDIPAHRRKA